MFSPTPHLLPWMTVYLLFLTLCRRKLWLLYAVWFWELSLLPSLGEHWPKPQPQPHSHTKRHTAAYTTEQKHIRWTYFQSCFHECNLHPVWHIYTRCTGPEVFSHELLFCKCVVLHTVYLSVECCQRYGVSKSEFLNENVTKWYVTLN